MGSGCWTSSDCCASVESGTSDCLPIGCPSARAWLRDEAHRPGRTRCVRPRAAPPARAPRAAARGGGRGWCGGRGRRPRRPGPRRRSRSSCAAPPRARRRSRRGWCRAAAKNCARITATPMAEPTRCAVCSMPPPEPARDGSTSARVRVTFGVTTRPPPSPASRNAGASLSPTEPDRCGTSRSMISSAAATETRPMTASLRPSRPTSRPLTRAETARRWRRASWSAPPAARCSRARSGGRG